MENTEPTTAENTLISSTQKSFSKIENTLGQVSEASEGAEGQAHCLLTQE